MNPIFLLSSRRSGSTFLAWTLSSHPHIFLTDESKIFIPLSRLYHWCMNDTESEYCAEFRKIAMQRMYTTIYEFYDKINVKKAKRWGEKCPQYAYSHEYIDCLIGLFPKCQIIHLVRDPRSAVASMVTKGWATFDEAIEDWIRSQRLISNIRTKLSPEQYLLVRHEDICRNRVAKLTEILNFLGEEITDEVKAYVVEHWNYPYSRPTSDITSLDGWITKLTIEQEEHLSARVNRLMSEYGYT